MKCIKSLKNLLINFLLPLKWNYVTCMHGDRTYITATKLSDGYNSSSGRMSSIRVHILLIFELYVSMTPPPWFDHKNENELRKKKKSIKKLSSFILCRCFEWLDLSKTINSSSTHILENSLFSLDGCIESVFFSSFESQRMRYILCIVV